MPPGSRAGGPTASGLPRDIVALAIGRAVEAKARLEHGARRAVHCGALRLHLRVPLRERHAEVGAAERRAATAAELGVGRRRDWARRAARADTASSRRAARLGATRRDLPGCRNPDSAAAACRRRPPHAPAVRGPRRPEQRRQRKRARLWSWRTTRSRAARSLPSARGSWQGAKQH